MKLNRVKVACCIVMMAVTAMATSPNRATSHALLSPKTAYTDGEPIAFIDFVPDTADADMRDTYKSCTVTFRDQKEVRQVAQLIRRNIHRWTSHMEAGHLDGVYKKEDVSGASWRIAIAANGMLLGYMKQRTQPGTGYEQYRQSEIKRLEGGPKWAFDHSNSVYELFGYTGGQMEERQSEINALGIIEQDLRRAASRGEESQNDWTAPEGEVTVNVWGFTPTEILAAISARARYEQQAKEAANAIPADIATAYEDEANCRRKLKANVATIVRAARGVIGDTRWSNSMTGRYLKIINDLETKAKELRCPSWWGGRLWHQISGGKAKNLAVVDEINGMALGLKEGLELIAGSYD
jgi:hypothetical protein